MSNYFQKENIDHHKLLTFAAVAIGAGAVAYYAYKYYQDHHKGKPMTKDSISDSLNGGFKGASDKLNDLSKDSKEIIDNGTKNLNGFDDLNSKISEGSKNVSDAASNFANTVNDGIKSGAKEAQNFADSAKKEIVDNLNKL